MIQRSVELERRGAVAWVWLSRPEVHNAFDAELVCELSDLLAELGRTDDVRVIVLAGRGRSFSAGAQVQWMQQQGAASREKNDKDAMQLAKLFSTLAELPKPTVARVHGAALGGGVGLVCACDIAIGSTAAVLGTTEVRLGLIPATIAPYVLRAVGERQARCLFQTGERLDAQAAQRVGLLHSVVEPEQLDRKLDSTVEALLAGAPGAQAAVKRLITAVAGKSIDESLQADTAKRIADRRAEPEAAEGLLAFLEKRPPTWVPQS